MAVDRGLGCISANADVRFDFDKWDIWKEDYR